MHRLEWICLHVSFEKRDVANTCGVRIAPPAFEKAVATVYREHRPGRYNQTANSIAVSPKPQPASITLSPLFTCSEGKILAL
jgi:hypothetical protein